MNKLTPEQEVQAFTLIRKGGLDGEKAKEIFIYFNQPLVGWVAKRYLDKGLSWEELLSAGNVGLLQAVNRFDLSRGWGFSTFAVPWIAGEIKQLFASTNKAHSRDKAVRATEYGVPLLFDKGSESKAEEDKDLMGKAAADLKAQDEPESERLSDYADLQEAVIQDAESQEAPQGAYGCAADKGGLGMNAEQARSEGIGSVGGGAEFSASLRGEEASEDPRPSRGLTINFAPDQSTGVVSVDVNLIPALEKALGKLEDPRQVKVIEMRLGLHGHKQHTFAEIGELLGVTLQRAHAIQREALMQLRDDSTLKMFFDLLA